MHFVVVCFVSLNATREDDDRLHYFMDSLIQMKSHFMGILLMCRSIVDFTKTVM